VQLELAFIFSCSLGALLYGEQFMSFIFYGGQREQVLEDAAKNSTFPPITYGSWFLGSLEVDKSGQLILESGIKRLIDVPIIQVDNILISDTAGGAMFGLLSGGVLNVTGNGANLYTLTLSFDLNDKLKEPVRALSNDLLYWKNEIKKLEQRNVDNKSSLTPPASSNADEIRKLSSLFNEGVLTAEEFAAAKKKLLGL